MVCGMRTPGPIRIVSLLMLILVGLLAGCSQRVSSFRITNYRDRGQLERFQEVFPEAYYATDPRGNVDVVLRYQRAADSGDAVDLTQIVHIHTVWKSIPGSTVSSKTQINGTVTYVIISGNTGATFEGGGSILFRENKRDGTLTGTLDLAYLRPKRQMTVSPLPFERADISGSFVATHAPRRVRRLIRDIDVAFGTR